MSTGYYHFGKPYEKVGTIPEKAIERVKELFFNLCNGMPGIGSFGTSGSRTIDDGAVQYDLSLDRLRMDHYEKVHDMIRKLAAEYDLPWLENELLEKEPGNNYFIISPNGELWGIIW